MDRSLAPIAAFDIRPDGTAAEVAEDWPAAWPGQGAAWRWLHCDRTAPAFEAWAAEHLPAPVRAALLAAETRPRAELVEGGLLVTLRGINFNPGAESEDMVAVRLWVTADLVVTTRFRRIFAVDEIRAEITSGAAPASSAAFLARLAAMLTAKIEAITTAREEATDEVEEVLLDAVPDAIGTGERQISQLARSIIKLRRHIAPQREALARLAGLEAAFIGPAERYELREVANRALRVVEELDATRDRLASLRQHIDSVHAGRIGRQGFVLSVVAAIFLPLGFLTGLFGVNVAGMPGTDVPWAFAVLTAAMAAIGVALWLVFRWLRWF
jgi:zinc transporter